MQLLDVFIPAVVSGGLSLWVTHAPDVPPVPTLTAAAEVGLTPESLIVCGAIDGGIVAVEMILLQLEQAESVRQSLAEARAAAEAAQVAQRQVQQVLLIEPDHPDLLAQLTTSTLELTYQLDVIAGMHQSLLDIALGDLPSHVQVLLVAWRESAAHVVPPSFRAAHRPDVVWANISRALRAEARSMRTGSPLHPSHAGLLESVRAEPAVVAAEQKLVSLASLVVEVFQSFGCETE